MGKIVSLIPAKSTSKSIIDKNLQKVGPYSLLEWSIRLSKAVPEIEQTYVLTDSGFYASLAEHLGAGILDDPYPRGREPYLEVDFVRHACKTIGEATIVYLRPTTPLRLPQTISKAIDIWRKQKGATSLRSVHELSETAFKMFILSKDEYLEPIKPGCQDLSRQLLPLTYKGDGYVDIIEERYFTETSIYGEKILPFFVPDVGEVDSLQDLEYVRYLYERNRDAFKVRA